MKRVSGSHLERLSDRMVSGFEANDHSDLTKDKIRLLKKSWPLEAESKSVGPPDSFSLQQTSVGLELARALPPIPF